MIKRGLAMMACFAMMGLSGPAPAQTGVEQLYLLPPAGWTVGYHDVKGNTELSVVLPPGQSLKDWTDMLTVELIQGKPTMDVQSMLKTKLDLIHQGCEDVGAGPAQLSVENGYDTGLRVFGCPKTKQWGKGEVSLYKVMLGHNRTYVVSRSWSGAPFEKDKMPMSAETTKDWLGFMSQVIVCDSGERTHPCPATK